MRVDIYEYVGSGDATRLEFRGRPRKQSLVKTIGRSALHFAGFIAAAPISATVGWAPLIYVVQSLAGASIVSDGGHAHYLGLQDMRSDFPRDTGMNARKNGWLVQSPVPLVKLFPQRNKNVTRPLPDVLLDESAHSIGHDQVRSADGRAPLLAEQCHSDLVRSFYFFLCKNHSMESSFYVSCAYI